MDPNRTSSKYFISVRGTAFVCQRFTCPFYIGLIPVERWNKLKPRRLWTLIHRVQRRFACGVPFDGGPSRNGTRKLYTKSYQTCPYRPSRGIWISGACPCQRRTISLEHTGSKISFLISVWTRGTRCARRQHVEERWSVAHGEGSWNGVWSFKIWLKLTMQRGEDARPSCNQFRT